MKKTFLVFCFALTHFISFAQCIEKHISEKSTSTYSFNAKNQPIKIINVTKTKKSIFNFKYDAKGNCIFIDSGSKQFNIKGFYNAQNQLSSTVCKLEMFIITNTFEYQGNEIVKINTTGGPEGINMLDFETMLTYENGNIIKMEVLDKLQDTLKTVIPKITYDTSKRFLTKEETMATLGFYMGNTLNTSLLELSRNNPLEFSYTNLSPDDECGENVIDIVNEYQYDAKNRVIKVTEKETCGEKVTTTNTKIERTCK